jgi:hypothetical protein
MTWVPGAATALLDDDDEYQQIACTVCTIGEGVRRATRAQSEDS